MEFLYNRRMDTLPEPKKNRMTQLALLLLLGIIGAAVSLFNSQEWRHQQRVKMDETLRQQAK